MNRFRKSLNKWGYGSEDHGVCGSRGAVKNGGFWRALFGGIFVATQKKTLVSGPWECFCGTCLFLGGDSKVCCGCCEIVLCGMCSISRTSCCSGCVGFPGKRNELDVVM